MSINQSVCSIFLAALLYLSGQTFAEFDERPAQGKKITAPGKIEYDNKIYKYNPAWQNQEIYLEANLDDEPNNEVIIGFISTYRPDPIGIDETRSSASKGKKGPGPSLNHAFYQIYKKGFDEKYHAIKTISGMDRPGRAEIINLGNKETPLLVFFSPGGEHYTDLMIYRWQKGGYRLLFNENSSKDIFLDTQKYPITLRILADKKPEKIFIWNQEKGNFKKVE